MDTRFKNDPTTIGDLLNIEQLTTDLISSLKKFTPEVDTSELEIIRGKNQQKLAIFNVRVKKPRITWSTHITS